MPSEATDRATRKEWRDLGFFYDRDDGTKEWRLVWALSGSNSADLFVGAG